ncbi:MAG: 5'/3'-nucleotidase SurE [Gammaproteobacteria bacterium]|nr:5'/3'-nucleotidase SurE [Gammaproteobacteria bacterium]MBU6508835.1 5'/3'-nucleotidase SurE [Gammaproteobacteria bacterium]MDE1983123.1 5'/3'-nucleotidase SurE [Gammaproteobacteria bacterium]MDE2108341.1 5'/3'-nucleotidase SurE [Gammaproteobacteria bacterium]MDE2460173.1 5'/3'-nucleotidase SurE [Gammaproteobacteria bacterium]
MRILLSNDDGYNAEGLRCLAQALRGCASVTVVAPDRNRSGTSHSLTLELPLRVRHEAPDVVCVDGTPTDCVHLAITGLLDQEPDMVVSGINAGANLGDDVLYSGTVAAAIEGRFLGYPAIALSLVGEAPRHFPTAARVACDLVQRLLTHPLPANTILNVNVPDVAWQELQGVEATRLGHRHRSETITKGTDPRGRPIYWVGPPGDAQDAGVGTDFDAVRRGFISVTPLQIDLTQYTALDPLSHWLQGVPRP